MPPANGRVIHGRWLQANINLYDDYWLEYYRPLALSSFLKIFAFRLASPNRVARDSRDGLAPSRGDDISPFVPRKKQQEQVAQRNVAKKGPRKGVTISGPVSEAESRQGVDTARRRHYPQLSLPDANFGTHSILRDPHFETDMPSSAPAARGSSRARGRIDAAAAGLHHSHSNATSATYTTDP